MHRMLIIVSVALVLVTSVALSVNGFDTVAQGSDSPDFTGHPMVGVWYAETPGGLAPAVFAADGSVTMALQPTQAGPMGLAFVSSEIGTWEPVSERGAHFTAIQILSNAEGLFLGTITIDGYPVVSEDGQSILDDGSQGSVTIRDAAHVILDRVTNPPPVTGVRMSVGNPGFPEDAGVVTTPVP